MKSIRSSCTYKNNNNLWKQHISKNSKEGNYEKSWFKNKTIKTGVVEDLKLYKIKRNNVTKLNEKPKKEIILF